jgi:hypothetical protein
LIFRFAWIFAPFLLYYLWKTWPNGQVPNGVVLAAAASFQSEKSAAVDSLSFAFISLLSIGIREGEQKPGGAQNSAARVGRTSRQCEGASTAQLTSSSS